MEIGTIKTIEEKDEKNILRPGLRNRSGRSGGDNSDDGGNNGGGGGGGGDRSTDKDFEDELGNNYPSNKFRIGIGFLLVVVMMTFGGLIAAYIVIATNGVLEWRPFSLPKPIWISTALLLASSVTYQISQNAIYKNKQEKAKSWLTTTTVLGGMFIASQLFVWLLLYRGGVYLQSNPYAGFFYVLTAVHAVHVIGGIIALGYIVLRTWVKTDSEKELERRKIYANVIGWYWHFMDGLWLVLLVLLGFWK